MSVVRRLGSRDRATDGSGYRSDHRRRIWNVLNVEVSRAQLIARMRPRDI